MGFLEKDNRLTELDREDSHAPVTGAGAANDVAGRRDAKVAGGDAAEVWTGTGEVNVAVRKT